MTRLGRRQRAILREALRRYCRFHKGRTLTRGWTGLGTATDYAPVVRGGYMEVATGLNPGYDTWWRLTAKGAAIVQEWLDAGITHETVEEHDNGDTEDAHYVGPAG